MSLYQPRVIGKVDFVTHSHHYRPVWAALQRHEEMPTRRVEIALAMVVLAIRSLPPIQRRAAMADVTDAIGLIFGELDLAGPNG